MNSANAIDRRGLLAALAAFVMWGFFPLFWYLLKSVPALQIIAHRVVWCGLFVVGFLLLRDGRGWLRAALSGHRVGRMLVLSSVLISCNWGVYIWAVTNGRVVEASLGYFINPLVNVLVGVLLLGESLNRAQWVAIAGAGVGVLWLAFIHGDPPWIALFLACSFGTYGLIRKVAAVESVPGLAVESLILLPAALGWIVWEEMSGRGVFGQISLSTDLLLIVGGGLTALPLIGFAYGARRIPYSLAGVLQYIAPTIQLLCGVLLLGETFSGTQAIGFSCIWLALLIYAVDGWRRSKAAARALPVESSESIPHCDSHVPAVDGAAPVCEPAEAVLSDVEPKRLDLSGRRD
jgi:chloramphenicol-sensitive protein RarD